MTNLEGMKRGDWVRWGGLDWEVTDRNVYRESAEYEETQWELEDGSSTRYLVRSEEKKPGGTEVVWVCTVQTGVRRIEYHTPGGQLERLREKNALDAPPPKVLFDGVVYSLDGETEGKAVDDEGNNVTKLTWDYYDATRRRNLAIEVWKCPDADYFEVYDGTVTSPSEFSRVQTPPRRAPRFNSEAVGHLVVAVFAMIFFLPIVGGAMGAFDVGAEYLLALLVPGLAVGAAAAARANGVSLSAACAAGVFAGAALVNFRGLGHGYWTYAAYAVCLGAACAEVLARSVGGVTRADKAFAAGCSSLLALFIVSLAHYVQFAPRPHNIGMLFAACLLPALPAAALFAAYLFLGGSDEQQA